MDQSRCEFPTGSLHLGECQLPTVGRERPWVLAHSLPQADFRRFSLFIRAIFVLQPHPVRYVRSRNAKERKRYSRIRSVDSRRRIRAKKLSPLKKRSSGKGKIRLTFPPVGRQKVLPLPPSRSADPALGFPSSTSR